MKIRLAIQFAAVMLFGALASAQDVPKAELSLDYSFARYAPSASYTKGHSFNGGGGAVTFNFAPHFGIAMDLQGYNSNTTQFTIPANSNFPNGASGSVSGNLFTYLFGPVFKFRTPRAHPYFDVLLGAAHSSVYGNAYKTICQPVAGTCTASSTPNGNGFAMTAGGGLDIPINQRVDFRVGEFDYLYTRFTNIFNDAGQNNFRYLAGLNIKMGLPNPKTPTAACMVEPNDVLPWAGPVTAKVTPTDFNPKHALSYSWEISGDHAADLGKGESAVVDTTSMTPGQYTVRATVTDPKQKKNNTATCTASFTVKQPRPPLLVCSASPATVKPGEPISITVSGSSPDLSAIDKRSFSASAGSLKEGETKQGEQPGEFTTVATLDTTNLAPGTITVNVGATDVHGLSSTCTASAEVVAPPAPPSAPTAQLAGKCNFNDSKRPARVDNPCKAMLDGVAMQLQREQGSRLVIIGFAQSTETSSKKGKDLESIRAGNVRDYLTAGEGNQRIDTSRIEIRKSNDQSVGKTAYVYVLPENAVLPMDNQEVVDESTLPTKRSKGAK